MGSCNEVVGSFFHVGTDDRENAAQRDLGDTFIQEFSDGLQEFDLIQWCDFTTVHFISAMDEPKFAPHCPREGIWPI